MKFIYLISIALLVLNPLVAASQEAGQRPNILVIFADDLGYGDLACFGHPTIATPNLDRMAGEGQRWTQFYVAAPICTPSRGALLTGRYPVRLGLAGGVLFEWSASGIDPEERTLAEAMLESGYRTAMVGKWHLGHREGFLPTRNGFECYYGIPYSNDMRVDPEMKVSENVTFREGMTLERMRDQEAKKGHWVPLLEGEEVVEYPVDQSTLTRRYTDRVLDIIDADDERPFFLYYAQNFPHVPLFASEEFLGTSLRGLYGDVVEELDNSVGRILDHLKATGKDRDTLVIFTSDNGPWMSRNISGGTAGLLSGCKGETWEGGFRVPTIFWWPGQIEPRTVYDIGSTLDFMRTLCGIAGANPDSQRESDSLDLGPTLLSGKPSPRKIMHFYRENELFAIRMGPWKAHFSTQGAYGRPPKLTRHDPPLLFNVEVDPSELYDVAGEHPDIVAKMRELFAEQNTKVPVAESRLAPKIEYQKRPSWAK